MHNKTHTHCKHSQDFVGLLPAHNKAKGCGCHRQGVADGAGGVAVEAADVLMRDFKPLLVGISDLSRERRHTGNVSVASYITVMFLLCCVHHYLCPLLFLSSRVKRALIKNTFELDWTKFI